MRRASSLKPATRFTIYKRNLPHYELPGSVYFITFRTSAVFRLCDEAKDITLGSIKFHSGTKYDLHASVVMDTHVHIILQPLESQARRPVPQSTVPPPEKAPFESSGGETACYSLAQIMHSIKSYSTNRIQRLLHWEGGPVWLDENYDRIVRDDEEYVEKMNYIIYNPVKAGFVERPEEYKWLCAGERL